MFLLGFMRKYRYSMLASISLSALNAALTLLLLAQINHLVNRGVGDHIGAPLLYGAGCLVALLAAGIVSQLVLSRLGGELVGYTRAELSRRFIELEYERLANRKHLIFGSLVEDIGRIAPLALLAPQLAYQLLLLLLYCGYLAFLSLPLFGVLMVCLSLVLVISTKISTAISNRFDALRQAEEMVFECFRAISEGKKEMTLNTGLATHFQGQVLAPAIAVAQARMTTAHRYIGFNNAWSITVSYASIFAVVYTGYAAFHLSVAVVTQFVVVALFLINPIGFITQALQQLATGLASVRHLQRVGLDLKNETEGKQVGVPSTASTKDVWQSIRAESLRYRYPNEADAGYELGPLNLEVYRGEMVFLTGGNGSGKSTLLLLLCGLITPQSGRVLIDGRPVEQELDSYRNRFAGVFGDFHLFSHVLDSEGQPADDDKINALLKRLKLESKVQAAEGKLSKLTLSTGQRKRLALLQCYAQDRDICFFDEWAADQDVGFREYFYESLLPELKAQGKTLLVISHDDRYFHVADRVVKLESGMVIDGGESADGLAQMLHVRELESDLVKQTG